MSNLIKPIILLFSTSLILSGCATTNNTQKGAAIGAIAGGILGKATSNHKNKRVVWGAAIGAIAGAAIGSYMDKQEQEFRQELSGTGIDVIREGNNIRLVMPNNITFAVGKSYISNGFHETLNAIAKVLQKYNKTLLSIEGHTDSTGSAEFNQKLSEQRANNVKNYLIQQNIAPNRLRVFGYGESSPLVNNNTASNRALNRRVEIKIIPNKS